MALGTNSSCRAMGIIEWFGSQGTFKDHLVQSPPAMGEDARDTFH